MDIIAKTPIVQTFSVGISEITVGFSGASPLCAGTEIATNNGVTYKRIYKISYKTLCRLGEIVYLCSEQINK